MCDQYRYYRVITKFFHQNYFAKYETRGSGRFISSEFCLFVETEKMQNSVSNNVAKQKGI
jgi:hypothetical protein